MDATWGAGLLEWAAARAQDGGWVALWRAVAFAGSPDFFAIALPLLYSFAPVRWALRLTLAFASSAVLSEALKHLVDRARPDPALYGLAQALEDPGSYDNAAFPSGHALMAMVIWGSVALHVRSTAGRVVCAVLVLAIGASRLALLRHDLLDVGAGMILGGLLLALLFAAEHAWGRALASLPRVERAGLWLAAAIALQVVVGLPVTAVVLGVAAGLGVGSFAIGGTRRRSRAPGWLRGSARAVLSLAGVAVVRAFAAPDGTWPDAALFAAYALAAAWIAGAVPWMLGGVWEREPRV